MRPFLNDEVCGTWILQHRPEAPCLQLGMIPVRIPGAREERRLCMNQNKVVVLVYPLDVVHSIFDHLSAWPAMSPDL